MNTRNILIININVGTFLKKYGKKLVLIIIFTHIPKLNVLGSDKNNT